MLVSGLELLPAEQICSSVPLGLAEPRAGFTKMTNGFQSCLDPRAALIYEQVSLHIDTAGRHIKWQITLTLDN